MTKKEDQNQSESEDTTAPFESSVRATRATGKTEFPKPDQSTGNFSKGNFSKGGSSERDLFFRAIEIEDPVEREHYLKMNCSDDKLRDGVIELLREHDSDSELVIDHSLFNSRHANAIAAEVREPGTSFGPYTLEKLLGEGGMGEVWLAKQSAPVSRQVALKLVRSGRETPGILNRFETERQALAAMDHPNIARVLDADSTPAGRPYFVMELVNGQALNDFCDAARLYHNSR